MPELPGLGALEDRILVGEIDAAHPAAGQGPADEVRLRALVDQHRQIRRAQGPERAGRAGRNEPHPLRRAPLEETHHLAGAGLGDLVAVGLLAERFATLRG